MRWSIEAENSNEWSIIRDDQHRYVLRLRGGDWFLDHKWMSRARDPFIALDRALRLIERAHAETPDLGDHLKLLERKSRR